MKKKTTSKKKSTPKKAPRKDAAQNALSIVEQVTGAKLKRQPYRMSSGASYAILKISGE